MCEKAAKRCTINTISTQKTPKQQQDTKDIYLQTMSFFYLV